MRIRLLAVPLLLLLCAPLAARADLVFDLLPAVQTGTPGTTLTFSGSLQNTGTSDLFLNLDNLGPLGPGLTLDDSKFFANVPPSLAANASTGPIPLFDVVIAPTASLGDYFGSFGVLGGADSSAQDLLATQTFQVTVVPEAGTLSLLMASVIIGLGVAARRRACRT